MLVLNGTEVYDFTQGSDKRFTEVSSTIHPPNDLALMMDGTTANMDAVHKVAATMTGGVGGAWTESSNWALGPGLLTCKAPIIAQAVNNLLSDQDASLEAAGVGGYTAAGLTAMVNSTAQAAHGTHSLACTGAGYAALDVTAVTAAATQYTISAMARGPAGRTLSFFFNDDVTGVQADPTPVIANGGWQQVQMTATYGAGTTSRAIQLYPSDAGVGEVTYWDAIQLEAGAVATPFALNSRTATTMTFPTASLGLTPGQNVSVVIAAKTPWAGNDGVIHNLFCAGYSGDPNGFHIYKYSAPSKLAFTVWDNATAAKEVSDLVDAANWPADTTHIVIATRSSAGALGLYLDGTALVTAAGAGTGLESSLPATIRIGHGFTAAVAAEIQAPILAAAFNRVLSANEISLLSRMGVWLQKMKGF